jgi:riboflavin kinase/FMN adenylyltransferase
MADYMRPAYGVYATRTRLPDGRVIDGVANLGVRPMFEIDQPLLEVWLFDFDEDLYGQTVETGLIAFLRGEMAFDGLDALKAQIDLDAAAARAVLSSGLPPSAVRSAADAPEPAHRRPATSALP